MVFDIRISPQKDELAELGAGVSVEEDTHKVLDIPTGPEGTGEGKAHELCTCPFLQGTE